MTDSPSNPLGGGLSRRSVLAFGAIGGLAAVVPALSDTPVAVASPTPLPGTGQERRAVTMAMHIHSAFSEGVASMQAHLEEATKHGIDAIWWTDHDFRLQALGYRKAVRFEGLSEPENGLSWTWDAKNAGQLASGAVTFVADRHTPDEPGKSMRVTARSAGAAWAERLLEGNAWNTTYTTSLAATVLEIDVLPETVGPDAEMIIRVISSYRPATAGRPAGQYTLEYRVGAREGRWTENNGLVGVVGILPQGGDWQRLTLDLQADVEALWPDIVSADAAINRLRVGVRSRNAALAAGLFDRLRFNRSRRDGQEPVVLQGEMIDEYRKRYPKVLQFQAAELSLVRHLNAYGGDFRLPDYGDVSPKKDTKVASAIRMVDFAHSNGSLVTFNHPLEDEPVAANLAKLLVETKALGADMIEVGSKEDFGDSVVAYDTALRNGLLVTATGVSDDHSGKDWIGQKQRWITSVWADGVTEAQLFASLQAGRAWFWDPQAWRGELDFIVLGDTPMGGVVVSPAAQVPVTLRLTNVPQTATVHLISGRVDYAGDSDPTPATTERQIRLSPDDTATVVVDAATSMYARVEVRSAAGAVIGFSNPVFVLKEEPANGIPAARRSH